MGNSSKIGGNSSNPLIQNTETQAAVKKSTPETPSIVTQKKTNDQFERQTLGSRLTLSDSQPPPDLASAKQGQLLQMVRDNPGLLKSLVQQLQQQIADKKTMVAQEKAALDQVVQELSLQNFKKEALKQKEKELLQKRQRLAALKMGTNILERKMQLLQSIGHHVAPSKLAQEYAEIAAKFKQLKSTIAKRQYLMSLGDVLSDGDDNAPDHLEQIISAYVRHHPADDTLDIEKAFQRFSPQRLISDMMARTLDGSDREKLEEDYARSKRGEFGETLKNFAGFAEMVHEATANDPLKKKTS